MLQFSRQLLNEFIPSYDDFTEANVPEISGEFVEVGHWMANHFLNRSLRGKFREGQLPFNLIYRAQAFFEGYEKARDEVQAFMDGRLPGEPRMRHYLSALRAWEGTLLDLQIAIDLMRTLSGKNLFEKLDGSPTQRAYDMANDLKHCASAIAQGRHPDPLTVPIWMTNLGLSSSTLQLTFAELAEHGRELGKVADMFQDPISRLSSASDL